MASDAARAPIRSTIPARSDRLRRAKLHIRMVIGPLTATDEPPSVVAADPAF